MPSEIEYLISISNWLVPILSVVFAIIAIYFIRKRIKEADALKYEFINVVTHKFRTPLTYINWSLDSIEHDKETLTESLRKIRQASIALGELTNMLVETVRTSDKKYSYNFKKVNVLNLIKNAEEGLSESIKDKNIKIEFTGVHSPTKINMDERRMGSVFYVLMENAVLYSPQNSLISIDVKEDGKYQTISIKDNGIGISKEDKKLIFSEFFRTKKATNIATEGMGIGLYISKRIVEFHGGKIWMESLGEDKGATFYIRMNKN